MLRRTGVLLVGAGTVAAYGLPFVLKDWWGWLNLAAYAPVIVGVVMLLLRDIRGRDTFTRPVARTGLLIVATSPPVLGLVVWGVPLALGFVSTDLGPDSLAGKVLGGMAFILSLGAGILSLVLFAALAMSLRDVWRQDGRAAAAAAQPTP